MSDREAFLRTIIENPDDDIPRLVFADWLEENGEPERAAFIRLQCQLASIPKDDDLRPELELNALRLYRGNREKWLKELPKLVGLKWGKFERGFVSEIAPITSAAFGRNVERMFAVTPLQSLQIDLSDSMTTQVQRIPDYVRLREFAISRAWYRSPERNQLRALISAPAIRRVRRLDLTSISLNTQGVEILPQVENCDWQDLRILCPGVTASPIFGLFTSPNLEALRSLRLVSWGEQSESFLEQLTSSQAEPKLRSLELEGYQLGTRGGRLLVQTPCLSRLESLVLGRGSFSNQSMIDLTSGNAMPHLRSLSVIPSMTLSEGCLRGLKKGTMPSRLCRFSLYAVLGDSGFARLLECGTWENLKHLSILNRSPIMSDESITRLCESGLSTRLRSLQIVGGRFSLKAVNRLLEQEWPKLQHIWITSLTPKGNERIKKHFGARFKWM